MIKRLMRALFYIIFIIILSAAAHAEDSGSQQQPQEQKQKPPQEVKLDMVSDTVTTVFSKANAILAGNMEITMPKKVEDRDSYTINAMGQRVPKATAIKSGGSLHNDQPL